MSIYSISKGVLITFICLLLTTAVSQEGFAQNIRLSDRKINSSGKSAFDDHYQLSFNNIDNTVFYRDDKKLKQIHRADEGKDYAKLQELLEEYIPNFGSENFSQDYGLLWMLGQLYEKIGKAEEAKYLYRLVLKHTEKRVDYIWQYYNELTVNDQENYVPVDYYYELVEYRKQIDTLRPPRGVFINMGQQVNSTYEDYGPSLNISNDMLLFASKRNVLHNLGQEVINEDIFWSGKTANDQWTDSEPFEGVNSRFNEGSPCLTRDGRKLYFIRCEAPDGSGSCDIYSAELISDANWGNVQNLGPNVNSTGWDSHPALSHTEDTLYFVSDREGGFGSTDIYYTVKGPNGKWTPAKNMGPIINTKGTDVSPFYHPKYNVLYFSSNGHLLNFGNFDIYKSHQLKNGWSEPKNIGPLVNGGGEEFYFTIDSDSKDLFYARSENDDFKNLDLFSFPLPMEAQPTATTVFTGSLVDSITGNPFEGIVSVIDLESGIEVAPKYVRPDGSFEFDLINHNKYLLIIQGEDFFRIEHIFDLKSDTTLEFKTAPVNTVKIEFERIEFATNSSKILPEMMEDLDKIMDFMLDNPKFKLSIAGHTDTQGNADDNFKLSQSRADAIKVYLVKKGGLRSSRIKAEGFGSTQPIIKEEITEEDRRLNRRVEFEIIRDARQKEDWGRRN